MTRVLIISDSPSLPASYGNAARWFADAVSSRGFEIGFGSVQHTGLPLVYEFNGRRYPHYGCAPPHRIGAAIDGFDPDIVLHLRDPVPLIPNIFQQPYSLKAQAKGKTVWLWMPVQHEVMPWWYVDACHREGDVVLPFTRAGGEALGNAGVVRDRIEPLPLGVSPSFSDPDGPVATGYGSDGVPMVMSVGLGHQDRKAFPILMRAYREVLWADPALDMDFYLHTNAASAYDLVEHAKMMGVDGHWIFPRNHDPGIGLTEEEMAGRYRRALAYVSTGTGEGWDMPLSEACSLGRVVVSPDEPNRNEVISDYDGPKLTYSTFPIPRAHNWERLGDPHSLAEQLLKVRDLKVDPTAGRRYYSAHTWDTVAKRFADIAASRGFK